MTKEEALENQFGNSVKSFSEALARPKDEFMRDSCILRFELVFDLSWKYIKKYLQSRAGVVCLSPKECFKEAYARGLTEYDVAWLKMTDERNVAVHTYKVELAEALYEKLPEFLKLFQELEKALKK